MEIIKNHNFKAAKQLIELDLQGKIKLDIYKSLHYAYLNNKKIFDLLIITYYKSIDFNKKVHKNIVLEQMIDIESKYLNFILTNVKINLNEIEYMINCFSYKSFKILLNIMKQANYKFNNEIIFINLCEHKSLKFVKLFISFLNNDKKTLINLILKKNIYDISILDYACGNRLNIVVYLTKLLKSFISVDLVNIRFNKSIDSDFLPNINMLIKARANEDIVKYLLENYSFNLNEKDYHGSTVISYIFNINIIKILCKYDGNINLEINYDHYKAIKKYRFLIKYINLSTLIPNNILFENSELFKLIKNQN